MAAKRAVVAGAMRSDVYQRILIIPGRSPGFGTRGTSDPGAPGGTYSLVERAKPQNREGKAVVVIHGECNHLIISPSVTSQCVEIHDILVVNLTLRELDSQESERIAFQVCLNGSGAGHRAVICPLCGFRIPEGQQIAPLCSVSADSLADFLHASCSVHHSHRKNEKIDKKEKNGENKRCFQCEAGGAGTSPRHCSSRRERCEG